MGLNWYEQPPYYITAYEYAKKAGYDGTEAEFAAGVARSATAADDAEAAAAAAEQSEETAVASATAAGAAQTAAETAQGKAEDAQEAAETAQTAAEAAQEAAETAQGLAEDAQEAAETAAATFETDTTLSVEGKAADAAVTGDRIGSAERNLHRYNVCDLFDGILTKKTGTSNGITYTWANGICTVSGEATSYSANVLLFPADLPTEINPGDSLYVKYETTDSRVVLRIIFLDAESHSVQTLYFPRSRKIAVPEGASQWTISIYVPPDKVIPADPGAVVSDVRCLNAKTDQEVSGELSNVLRSLTDYNAYDLISGARHEDGISGGLTYTWDEYTCTVSAGTSTGPSANVLLFRTALDAMASPGSKLYVKYHTTDSNVRLRIIFVDENETPIDPWLYFIADRSIVVPEGAAFWEASIYVSEGKTLEENVVVSDIAVLTAKSNKDLDDCFKTGGVLPNGTDLNDVTDNGVYVLQSGYTYAHSPLPSTSGGPLRVYRATKDGGMVLQIVTTRAGFFKMRCSVLSIFSEWIGVQGETNNYYNTYQTDHYENTYNIECTPEITTDTNNYLASTGDDTDRTGDIQAMLDTTGVCRLGPGVFYVTGVEVPNYGSLIGSGKKTQLILASSVSSGYAVRLKTYSTVRDMYIRGSTTDITPSAVVGNRHGILFEGTADSETPQTYFSSYVTGCLIRNFAGGGITCYNTGLSPASSLVVSDVQISKCDAGINVSYYSEFHRWTNVSCTGCYYGCVDNGGNNNFCNCDFSQNKQALLIDNSTGQSRNNTHGTFSACTFHHSDNVYADGHPVSVGVAIQILGAKLTERFVGCLVGYGKIEIDDAAGIQFSSCYFGSMASVKVTNSRLVTFDSCQFRSAADSPLTQADNISLLFDNCHLYTTGESYDPMS